MGYRLETALWAASMAALLVPGESYAQANDEVGAGIRFNFSLPGARSMAMGGTLLGAADDATAAYTNPGGLTTLRKPEVSLEGRYFRYEHEFIVGGHGFGTASGVGADTHTGLIFEDFQDSTVGLGYASVVLPAGRFAIALYRHELANFEARGEGGGEFVSSPSCPEGPNPFGICRQVLFRANLDLAIASYGLSAAYRVSDAFSLGLGVAYHDATLDSRTDRYESVVDGSVFHSDPPSYAPERLRATTIQSVDDRAVAMNVGFVWRATDWLNVGAVWRRGPKFDFHGTVIQGAALNQSCSSCFYDEYYESAYHVPDVYGVGLLFHSRRIPLRVALDVNRVRYSQIMDGFVNIVAGIANDASFAQGSDAYSIDDATEARLGIEYVLAGARIPVALRAGAWHEPDHALRNDGSYLASERARFAGGDDQLHVTAGIGVVVGRRLQLDAAFDHADEVDSASLSAVLFF